MASICLGLTSVVCIAVAIAYSIIINRYCFLCESCKLGRGQVDYYIKVERPRQDSQLTEVLVPAI